MRKRTIGLIVADRQPFAPLARNLLMMSGAGGECQRCRGGSIVRIALAIEATEGYRAPFPISDGVSPFSAGKTNPAHQILIVH
jgi:hypothetical protein